MNAIVWVAVVAVVVIVAIAAYFLWQKRRTDQLKERFGPEYDRTVDEYGDRRKAEPELLARERRVKRFQITSLSDEERGRFADAWRSVQAHFVDDPGAAVAEADELVGRVMQARGYPVTDFEQQAADVSVDHPEVVSNYRAAHDIALQHGRGEADTEDLRQAMVHYRALFEELLEAPATQPAEA